MNRRNIQLPVDELVARYEAGESTHVLGHAYGVNSETVRDRLHAAGVKMRKAGGQPGHKYGSRLGIHTRGGPLQITDYGYLRTRDRDGEQCRIHRACWEAHRGPIPEGWVVHHIDGNKLNNDIENLACMPDVEHKRLHRQKEATNGKA